MLIGVFNEEYGFIHILTAVIFYLSLSVSQVIYGRERKSMLTMLVVVIYWVIWIVYFLNRKYMGLAVPELASSLLVVLYFLFYETRYAG